MKLITLKKEEIKMSKPIHMIFELSDVEYVGFQKIITRMNLKTIASRLPGVDFQVSSVEHAGLHLVEIHLDTNDSSEYDLVGKITRLDDNRQWVELIGQYVNATTEDYQEIMTKQDIRELPCSVCGGTFKRRRNMFILLDNANGEYEHVGSECVQKLLPEWSSKMFQRLYLNLIKLQSTYANKIKAERSSIDVKELLHAEYDKWMKTHYDAPQAKDLADTLFKGVGNYFNNNVMPNFYKGYIVGKNSIGVDNGTDEAYAIQKLIKPAPTYNSYLSEEKIAKIDDLELKYKANFNKVQEQYHKGRNFFSANIQKVAGKYNNFDGLFDTIKDTREWPDKPGYNLREVVGAGEVRPELVAKVKKSLADFLERRYSAENIRKEVDFLDKKVFEQLHALDTKFGAIALQTSQQIDQLTHIDIKF